MIQKWDGRCVSNWQSGRTINPLHCIHFIFDWVLWLDERLAKSAKSGRMQNVRLRLQQCVPVSVPMTDNDDILLAAIDIPVAQSNKQNAFSIQKIYYTHLDMGTKIGLRQHYICCWRDGSWFLQMHCVLQFIRQQLSIVVASDVHCPHDSNSYRVRTNKRQM